MSISMPWREISNLWKVETFSFSTLFIFDVIGLSHIEWSWVGMFSCCQWFTDDQQTDPCKNDFHAHFIKLKKEKHIIETSETNKHIHSYHIYPWNQHEWHHKPQIESETTNLTEANVHLNGRKPQYDTETKTESKIKKIKTKKKEEKEEGRIKKNVEHEITLYRF